MQLAKMIVLGSLEILEPASGYDIFQYLDYNKIDEWTDVKKPSIYNALKQLEKQMAIEPVEEVQIGNYPKKILYKTTEKGKKMFDSLQEEAFLGIYPKFFGFKLALKFNKRKSIEEIDELAAQAIKIIDEKLAKMSNYINSLDEDNSDKKRYSFFIEHDRKLFITEKEWITDALEYIKNEDI